ncbi:beta strand repeat-containing protein, partial [Pedobacter alluvionis]
MRKFYKKVFHFLFIIPVLLISVLSARAALSKGDLAVIGMNGDVDAGTTIRSFAVVALNTIAANEVIYITDRGWVNTYGSTAGHFVGVTTTNEGTLQWQPSVAISAGTVIIFKIDLANRQVLGTKGDGSSLPADFSILSNSWTNTTLSANPWNPATGDQLLIYQGSESSPSFIFAFNNLRLNVAVGTSSNGWHINPNSVEPTNQLPAYSELPSDLGTSYSTAFFTSTANSRYPNVKYNPTLSSGSKATILADITNTANWVNTTSSGTPYNFSLGFSSSNIKQFNLSSSTAPTVTASRISISGASGTGGAFKIGDVVTGTWDNTASGDNNSGLTAVTMDFSQFGGGAAVSATDNSGTWTATYTIAAGTIDATNRNISITATNSVGPTTTADDANATVDNQAASVVITSTAGASGGSTSTSPIPFTVTFSETVTGFVAGDIIPGNATISGFSGSGTTYTFNATPTANGAVTINVAANIAQDDAGNGNTAASQFSITYGQAVAAPTVTALSPTSGPTSGGTSVTITGTDFSGATAVTFGATAATGFTVNSATQITATSPAGTGTVDVRITTTGGTSATSASDQFTYVAAPTVTALSPISGPTSGGTSVTITGTNFSGATAVTFGATAATGFTVNSATQITATAPAGTGTVDVRITTTGGTSATSASDQFTYIAAPTVTALSPTSGPTSGGTSVTITGTNFSGTTAVTFGATSATGFTVNSATQITATSPAGTGTVDVRITTTGGTSATSSSDQFTYVAAPTVTALSPTSGPTSGGTSVTITGTNFSGATAVTFGATAATGFTVNSATQITATAPAGTGTVDVRVTTTGGTSATSASDQFTYVQSATATPVVASPSNGSLITTTAPDYTGTATAGATVTVYVDGASLGTTTATGGNWSLTQPAALAQGSHTVYATAQETGNAVSANSTTNTFTVDSQRPSVAITSTAGATGGSTSTSPIPFTVTFSETVTGFVAGDITPGNATISGFSGSGTTYTFNATPTANGAVTISIAANVALDAAGNGNTAASQFSITYGQTVTATPTVANPANGSLITTTAPTYTGTATADATVTVYVDGASLGTTTATGGNWSLTQPAVLAQGSHTVYATAQETGNAVSANSTTNTFTVDSQRPSVAITSTAGASGGSTSTSPIPFTVTFSETVTGFVAGDITPGNATISGFSGSGTTYTFNATPTANGAVTISIAANVALDAAGNGNTAASQFSITYTQASQITASAGTFPSALSTIYGTASTSTSVNVSATGLTAGITATPSSTANFEVSADGTNFGTSAIIGTSGTVSGTVYVRLTATAAANTNITGNITLTSTGTNSPVITIPTSTVAQRVITVTAAAKSKTYGDADPALTYTSAPALVTGDSFSGSLTRLPGENVGTYAINQGTLALSSNYTLTYVGADLTIGAKTITVTAAAKSKTYGDADPALTYTSAPSLVTGDSFSGSLTRLPGENVGTYAINQGTLALNSNYTLTYVGADLTIGA